MKENDNPSLSNSLQRQKNVSEEQTRDFMLQATFCMKARTKTDYFYTA